MAGRVVGMDTWWRPRDLPGGEGPVREVKDDLLRVTPDELLRGKSVHWRVAYRPRHPTPDPWRGVGEAELSRMVDDTLARSGLAGQVRRVELQRTTSHVARVHLLLELDPASRLDDRQVYQAFAAAWPKDQAAIPPITVGMDMTAPAAVEVPALLPGQEARGALARAFAVGADGQVHVRAERLTGEELGTLKRWAGRAAAGGQRQSPARQLLALLGSDTALSTSAGRDALDTLKALRPFSDYWRTGMELLAARFPPRRLERSTFLYNGHATFAMTSLLPTLKAFSPAATNLWLSKHSGNAEAREIIRAQRPTQLFSEAKFDQGLEDGMIAPTQTIADLLTRRMDLPQRDWETHHFIVDKLGPWLSTLGGRLPPQVPAGMVRAIVHNRDDLDAIAPFSGQLWGVDFANSEVKRLEARFIGEQFALMAAREARLKGWGRIGDLPVIINGFGLLGEQAAQALVRLGMPPERVQIRDLDPAALERARAQGFAVTPARAARAVVINATPALGLSQRNLHTFGDELLVLSMSSGGKGVDLKGLSHSARSIQEVPGGRRSQRPIKDLDLELPGPAGQTIRARVIAEGMPPNLVDEMWSDRYQVTSLGVAAATLLAAELERPGVVPFDPQLDRALVDAAERAGLLALRPLDARAGDDPRALVADLDAFRPSAT